MNAADLERAADCAVATLAAFTYPSDTTMCHAAVMACELAGVDYLESIAQTMEATAASADTARWKMAQACFNHVVRLTESGAAPRFGVLATGRPANGLGMSITEE